MCVRDSDLLGLPIFDGIYAFLQQLPCVVAFLSRQFWRGVWMSAERESLFQPVEAISEAPQLAAVWLE
jgi:hypothetical protein